MSKGSQRVRILSDGDGHTYFVPVGKEDAFQTWLDAGPYWEGYSGEDFSEYVIGCSLTCYTFADPKGDR